MASDSWQESFEFSCHGFERHENQLCAGHGKIFWKMGNRTNPGIYWLHLSGYHRTQAGAARHDCQHARPAAVNTFLKTKEASAWPASSTNSQNSKINFTPSAAEPKASARAAATWSPSCESSPAPVAYHRPKACCYSA